MDAPELCEAYFQCERGYYLTSTTGLTCEACLFPEARPTEWVALSQGLTFGDAYSCMYGPKEALNASNALGKYGSLQTSCPGGGFTSRAGAAATLAGCIACPNEPTGGGFKPGRFDCTVECKPQFERRGEACIHLDTSLIACDRNGYAATASGCEATLLPWNSPGSMTASSPQWTVTAPAGIVSAAELESGFTASPSTLFSPTGALCKSIRATTANTAYVENRPLFAVTCEDTESHTFYLLLKGGRHLYAFLERSFGSNNRFVMWQVETTGGTIGQVYQTWRLPGRVCSAAWAVLDGTEYVFAAFCGAPFVIYVKIAGYDGTTQVSIAQTLYPIGRRYGMLIGRMTPGMADGSMDVARFGSALTVSNTSDPRRLLVADQENCRLVEIVIDQPGSFLTRATSIGEALCYTSDHPMPSPRLLTSVLGGAWALFLSDFGLMQMDHATRRVQLVVPMEEIPLSRVRWIGVTGGGAAVVMHNGTHLATATAGQIPCPSRHSSRKGGACVPCPRTSYAAGENCIPCSNPVCQPGTALVPCGAGSDAYCRVCSGFAKYPFRFDGNCSIVPISPCPVQYYAIRNSTASDCAQCPPWYGPEAYASVPAWGVCSCFPQARIVNGVCELASPFATGDGPFAVPSWALGMNCTYQECQERGCFLSKALPRTCSPCPPGRRSSGGLWCEPCQGFRTPTPAQDECVCMPPSAPNDGEECVCPAGHSAEGVQRCAPCAAGDYQAEAGVMLAGRSRPCARCPPGTESQAGATGCTACEAGKYKEAGMTACGRCASETAFASDGASGASCRECSRECAMGQRWGPCPLRPGWFTCVPCTPQLQATQEYVTGGDNRECWWQCLDGHYASEGGCTRCTTQPCPPGYIFNQCTSYADRDCSTPCVNSTMPAENAEWATGCEWRCAPGFDLQRKQVVTWVEYACTAQA